MRRPLLALLWSLFLLSPLGFAGQADAVTMKTTRFIANFEGFISCPYADPAGHATIGYGHLLHYGPPTRKDRLRWGCLTQKQALKLLRKDLKATENELFARLDDATVTPNMITALTSFTFNLGAGCLDYRPKKGKAQATNIAWNVRNGNYRRAAKQMLLFDGVIVNGKRYELEGLQIRRRKEFRLMVRDIDALGAEGSGKATSKSGGLAIR